MRARLGAGSRAEHCATGRPPGGGEVIETVKQYLRSKTVRVAVAQAVAGIIMAIVASDPKLQAVGAGAIIKSVIDVFLRSITSEPVDWK